MTERFIPQRVTPQGEFIALIGNPHTSREGAYHRMVQEFTSIAMELKPQGRVSHIALIRGRQLVADIELYAITVDGTIVEQLEILRIKDGLFVDSVFANADTFKACQSIGL